jgi:uncharacterized Zn finger protein (UPF0148 family)
MSIGECVACGFPLSATEIGTIRSCPNCSVKNKAIAVGASSNLLLLGVGLLLGILALRSQ